MGKAKQLTKEEIQKLAKKAVDEVLSPIMNPKKGSVLDKILNGPGPAKIWDDMEKKQKKIQKELDELKKGKAKPLDPKKSSTLEHDFDELKSLGDKANSTKPGEESEAEKLLEQMAKQMGVIEKELCV